MIVMMKMMMMSALTVKMIKVKFIEETSKSFSPGTCSLPDLRLLAAIGYW